MTALWWVRDDLRLHDNPALAAAAEDGDVIAVHVDERIEGVRELGGATLWWLHHSLARLGAALRARGVPLVLVSGDPEELIPQLVRDSGFEKAMGGSLRTCKEKFYGAVHCGLRTWVAAAREDGWDFGDVRYGPRQEEVRSVRSSPKKKPGEKVEIDLGMDDI